MSLAYIVQVHKNFEQVKDLIEELLHENIDVYIHVDLKNNELYKQLKEAYTSNVQVRILENRVSVNWSGFSQVVATLNLMNEVKKTKKSYDYISFISGQDFPIQSIDKIKAKLFNSNKEYIEYEEIGKHFWRIECYNFFRENPQNRTLTMRIIDNLLRMPQKLFIRRKNFKGYNLYFGSCWFTITQECLKFILDFLENNPNFIENFKYTACPDEHFFQIIILNSKFKENVVNDNLRYIDWSGGKNSPEILTIKDFNKIISSNKFYARKFDYNIDKEVIEKIKKSNFLD